MHRIRTRVVNCHHALATLVLGATLGCDGTLSHSSDARVGSDMGSFGDATTARDIGVSGDSGPVIVIPTLDAGGEAGVIVPPSFFDACGGRIFDPNGVLNVAEYRTQANSWSTAIRDCRLGPKFADVYGTQEDPRPTAYMPPRRDCTGTCNASYPNYYQLGAPSPNGNRFGVLTGQVVYQPDTPGVGIDEFTTFAWANNAVIIEPWISSAPARYITFPFQNELYGGTARQPVAISRSLLGANSGALAIFQNGWIGGIPDRFAVSTNRMVRLPDGFVPTAIARSNSNEFALVTAWNVNTQTGHLFVLAIGDALPHVHALREWLAPPHPQEDPSNPFVIASSESMCRALGNRCYGVDYAPLKILGQIELPIHTPTAIVASFDNGTGLSDDYLVPHLIGNYQWGGGSFDPDVRRRIRERPNGDPLANAFARSGYAIVLSRWENRAVFIDLQPLVDFVIQKIIGPDFDAVVRNNRGNAGNEWPLAFSVAPEQIPRVVAMVDVPHPTAALAGRWHPANSPMVKAHIATLDGTVRTFAVDTLGTTETGTPNVRHLFSTQVGPNPVSMSWPYSADGYSSPGRCAGRRDPCAYNNPYDFNHQFMVVSRARREIDFVRTGSTDSVIYRRLRDARMNDPVSVYPNPHFSITQVTVADFTGRQIINYRLGPLEPDLTDPGSEFPPGANGEADFECGGFVAVPGFPFDLSVANVP